MASTAAVATSVLTVAVAGNGASGGSTPTAASANAMSSSSFAIPAAAADSGSSSASAVAAAPPQQPHHGPTASASLYLENALSSLSAAAAEMEERFAARKLAFKASLQERINAFRAPAQPPQPQQQEAAALEAMKKARVAARIAASVTYRPPMRDPEDSLAGSSTYHQGPQSSAGGGSGMGGRAEQSLTARDSQWRASQMQRGELRRLDSTYDLSDDDGADADPNGIGVTLDPTDEAYADAMMEDRVPEGLEVSRNSCCVMHTLTVHKDNCDEDAHPHAHAHATIDVLASASARSRSASLAGMSSNSHSTSGASSATVSLRIHAEADAIAVDEATAATAATTAAAAAAAAEGAWLVSALDPAFIVAPASPELLGDDVWHEHHDVHTDGHLVPRAPAIQCACAWPWRSLTHLHTHHLQPESHARNVVFEGARYPTWRGQYYCNGEPKPILRGVLHEIAFVLAVVEMCALFPFVQSGAGWIAASISIAAQLLLFGVSSQFHRRLWLLPTYNRLKRMDHSAIFLLAAGSSTPGGILLLRAAQDSSLIRGDGNVSSANLQIAGAVLLCWAWCTALLGVAHSFTKQLSGKVSLFGLVWMGVSSACMVPFVWFLYQVMLPVEFAFLWVAWAIYLLGVMTYSRGWFNTWPSVWGYHEVFHLCTILGGICTGVFNFSICMRLT